MKPPIRLTVCLAFLLPLFLLGTRVSGTSTALQGSTPSQWRVIWEEDPAHEATISWSTAVAAGQHRVLLSKRPLRGAIDDYEQSISAARNGRYTLSSDEAVHVAAASYHHADLRGLEASTTYWFVIESAGVASAQMHFTTAPIDDREFKIVYGGDSRTGHEDRQAMNRMMAELTEADDAILAFAHGGDYVYDGRKWEHWSAWLTHHELCRAANGRVLPIVPVRGNHDVGPLFDEIFDSPGGAERNYYVTQLAPKVALLTLNSEISTTGDQARWLEEQLARLRPANRWLLAEFHRPLYPAVKTPGAAKTTWVPLFERFDVDLVLESDGHVIKRTVPIRNEKADPTGVTYIGEGGLGVPQRTPDSSRWYLKPPGMSASGHHLTLLDFSPEHLDLRTVGLPLSAGEFEPAGASQVVEPQAEWRYLAGTDPAEDWRSADFDDSSWASGPAGFGFGDDDDATVLSDMRGRYTRVYVRHRIPSARLEGVESLALMLRYDDAFIGYANGIEFSRQGIERGAGANAAGISSHEARDRFSFVLVPGWSANTDGSVVIAIEGHNNTLSSSDFTLDPYLIADPVNLSDLDSGGALRIIDQHRLLPRQR